MSETNPPAQITIADLLVVGGRFVIHNEAEAIAYVDGIGMAWRPPKYFPHSYPVGASLEHDESFQGDWIYPDEARALAAALSGEVDADAMRAKLAEWERQAKADKDEDAEYRYGKAQYDVAVLGFPSELDSVLADHGYERVVKYRRIAEGAAQ